MYLDYAEMQAKNKKVLYMEDWIVKLDAFLQFNEQNILQHVGNISNELALEKANEEFDAYTKQLDINRESDFDKLIKQFPKKK